MARSFAPLFATSTFYEAMARLRLDPANAFRKRGDGENRNCYLGRQSWADQDAKRRKSRFLAKERLGDAVQPGPHMIRKIRTISPIAISRQGQDLFAFGGEGFNTHMRKAPPPLKERERV
jgi:hypothetical protein